ncbi:hypothetical protein ACFPOH_00905 [Ureibacillus suwonensis]|uniref:Uncharacterized protein n=1 Tax=Ureibacillus suwonensis TaxID=313007 RepID=A0ABW0R7X0_9BACL
MNKKQVIFLNRTHKNFNLYIGNKGDQDFFKELETAQPVSDKVIPIDRFKK